MRKNLIVLLAALLIAHLVSGQQEADTQEEKYTLHERYQLLKSRSEDYKEYKVIKENVLDNFWKVVRDSLASRNAVLKNRNQNIQQLNAQLTETQATLKQKEESMAAIQHASTHIQVLGIDFSKSLFITIVAIMFALLLLAVALIIGRLRLMHSSIKERADALDSLSQEFEEYKRKAMEKQMKLSRELQNERNRLSEMRGM